MLVNQVVGGDRLLAPTRDLSAFPSKNGVGRQKRENRSNFICHMKRKVLPKLIGERMPEESWFSSDSKLAPG